MKSVSFRFRAEVSTKTRERTLDKVRHWKGVTSAGLLKGESRDPDVARMAYVRVDDEVDVGEVVGKLRDMEEIETPAEARERRLIRPRAAKGMG
jgi:hypothetical protein